MIWSCHGKMLKLADKSHLRVEVRQRVMEAVKELGYSPSRVARSLRVSRTNSIGLVIADIENPFSVQLVKTIEEYVFDWQYNIIDFATQMRILRRKLPSSIPFLQKMLQA